MQLDDLFILVGISILVILPGEIVPWIILRSRGIDLSVREYFHAPVIKRSIFWINHNNRVFDTLKTIQNNELYVTLADIEKLHNANIDFVRFVDAIVLAKNKNVVISTEVLKGLAERNKDFIEIINSKKPGEQVLYEEAFHR